MRKTGARFRLDAIDLRILSCLQEDARITNLELATLVGLSPSPCLQRVKRLEREGVIVDYRARIDMTKIARHIDVFVTVKLQEHSMQAFRDFETKVQTMKYIVSCACVSGSFDYLLRFTCPDIATYTMLQNELLQLGAQLANIASHIMLSDVMPFRGYALEDLLPD